MDEEPDKSGEPLLDVQVRIPLPVGLGLEAVGSAESHASEAKSLREAIGFDGRLMSIESNADGLGVALNVSVSIRPRKEGDPKSPPGFDPWTATPEEAGSYPGEFTSLEFGDWAMAHMLTEHRASIEADGVTLLSAVDMVLGRGLVAPRWLSVAFSKRWHRFNAHELRTLDEVFGHRPMDPRSMRAARRSAGLRSAVHAALCDAVRADPAQPIHAGFPYEQVADAFGIGKTLCYDLYRKAVDDEGLQDIVELRKLLNRAKRKGKGPA